MVFYKNRKYRAEICAPEDIFLPVDTDGGKLTVEAQDKGGSLHHNRKGCDRVDLGPVSAVIYKMEK